MNRIRTVGTDFPTHSSSSDFFFPMKDITQIPFSGSAPLSVNPVTVNGGRESGTPLDNGGGVSEINEQKKKGVKIGKIRKPHLKRKENIVSERIIQTRLKTTPQTKRPDYAGMLKANRMSIESEEIDVSDLKSETNAINYDTYTYGKFYKDIMYSTKIVPISYHEAVKDPKWREAINAEIEVWKKLNVFTLVEKSKVNKPLPVQWLFTIKSSGKHKGRIVAAGNFDPEKYEKKMKRNHRLRVR